MTSFLSVEIPDDADLAMVWAIEREFELRDRRRRFREKGLLGIIEPVSESIRRLAVAFRGLDDAVKA